MYYRKSREELEQEKKQKQLAMVQLEKKYEEFLAKKVEEKREIIRSKHPEITTIFEKWVYGTYISLIDHQQKSENTGKIYFIFENISESENKYKISYDISDKGECSFNLSQLTKLPKTYLDILKRHNFDVSRETANVAEFVCAHFYKLNDSLYFHHLDGNKSNNNIKNLAPLDKEFYENLPNETKNNLSNPQQYIPEICQIDWKYKAKDVVKMEYRALDLYFNHKIPIEKIAKTLRNRMNKAHILRTIKLYPYFRKYAWVKNETENE